MTSKTTTKAASPKTSKYASPQQSPKQHSRRKSNRINRQRRLQKQLQILILERHSRRCIICHHPEREDIEEEFVHWRSPSRLAHDYKLGDYRTIYRHARAAGLLLQRRERLHSALDAFVESVDDVTFTGDTILRAMRAYNCIDSHGRWTEIPTQVQFSTSNGAYPPQPSTRPSNVSSDVIDIDPDPDEDSEEDADNALEQRVTALDVLNVVRKYANQASPSDATPCSVSPKIKSPSDATFCAAPPAQALDVTEDEYADPENDAEDDYMDDDSDADEESEDDAEEAAENELLEGVTSVSTSSKSPSPNNTASSISSKPRSHSDTSTACSTSSKSPSHSDTTACAAPPAQSASAVALNSNNRGRSVTATACSVSSKIESHNDTTACAAPPAQTVSAVALNSNNRGRSVTATACADSPAQALPRDVVRGHNPNDRSLSDRTDCAALPAQPAAPQKPKPDADGLIWHPHPGYPNQERSEPDAQGRVFYKIHMTTPSAQLPSRETDAQRAAKLIYGSVIKKYGNP
jgi:hypothetical protein